MNEAELLPAIFAQYPFPVSGCAHLRSSENRVWRVEAPGGLCYALRLRRWGAASLAPLQSELQYLCAVRAGTGLPVPLPVPNRAGGLFCTVGSGPDQVVAVLFTWVPGAHVDASRLSREQVGQMASATGALHRFAQGYRPPADFQRPVYDHGWYFGPAAWSASPAFVARLEPGVRARLLDFSERVAGRLRDLPRDGDTFGLIHYDLHAGNFLFSSEAAHPLDFDELGFGYYRFDLAHLLFAFMGRPEFHDLRETAWSAYRQAGGPAARGGDDLDVFLSLQGVAYLNWLNRLLVRDGNTAAMAEWLPVLLPRLGLG